MRKILAACLIAALIPLSGCVKDNASPKQYVSVAANIIASYSRNGIIDFSSLARALEKKGNAELAGEVLRELVKVESSGDPRRVIRTSINSLDVASVVKQVSDPRFLEQIQICLKQQPVHNGPGIAAADPLSINETVSYLIYNRLFAMKRKPA